MRNTKKIIMTNLINLRKQNKFTQQKLAEMINYNDKAISRWESGQGFPDIEVIDNLCDIYGVSFSYLLEDHKDYSVTPAKQRRNFYLMLAGETAALLFAILFFLYSIEYLTSPYWLIFVFLVPFIFVILLVYNRTTLRNRVLSLIFLSLLMWSLLTSIFLGILVSGKIFWQLFLVGIPLEAGIFIYHLYRYRS